MTATNNTINFTTRTLGNLPKPANGKSKEYSDAKVRNLKAEITPAGTISFWFRGQRDATPPRCVQASSAAACGRSRHEPQ